MSRIEALLLRQDFDYLKPYFYSNPWALRCELGLGADPEAFRRSARDRAKAIDRILFPEGPDAIIFSQWLRDWSGTGGPEAALWEDPAAALERILAKETRELRFLLEHLQRFRHVTLRDLGTYLDPEDPDFSSVRRNRVLCYRDAAGFDAMDLIEGQLREEDDLEVGLVSFRNECILSVYDDRGCDVVFGDPEHFRQFYPLLRPYFLPYDLPEMERRYREA